MSNVTFTTEAPLADRFAQIAAEYKAIKELYDAIKEEAIDACMAACGPTDTKSNVDGDKFYLKFSFTETHTFSQELAKSFLTEEQIAQCYTTGTRRNIKAEPKAKIASKLKSLV